MKENIPLAPKYNLMQVIYDLESDTAGLSYLRDIMMIGDVFEDKTGKKWIIVEVDRANHRFLIIEEHGNE